MSLPWNSAAASWKIPPKREKLILKPSTLATSLLHMTGCIWLADLFFLLKCSVQRWQCSLSKVLVWGQRGSTSPRVLMVILRQWEQLLDCTGRRNISIGFLLCGVRVRTFEPRVELPDAQTTCLSWHTGKHCSSVKNWHLLLPPFGPNWEPYCDSLGALARKLHIAPHWRISYKHKRKDCEIQQKFVVPNAMGWDRWQETQRRWLWTGSD